MINHTTLKRTVLCLLLCLLFLTGCGRSLVFTTGFRRGEVFKLGGKGCRVSDLKVFLLDLQKQSEALYSDAIWESGDKEAIQEAVREQALARVTRVKAMGIIGRGRDLMLTMNEESLAEKAAHNYYAGLSEAEKKYLALDEKDLQRIFSEYALAEKVYISLGEQAEQIYDDFLAETQCDLNTKLWQKIRLEKIEGDLSAPDFLQCYREQFPGVTEAADEEAGTGNTASE